MNKILIIYTGGTIGMIQDPKSGALQTFNFDQLLDEVPELTKFKFGIDTYSFDDPIDSSNATPQLWLDIADVIENNYKKYIGFVILHGTDTMAYTASALSFILKGLSKPVILTGSQVPIGMVRTDGKENLITAIEIAATRKGKKPIVSEVAVFFENELHRGNRTIKLNAAHFNAFSSPNYPNLAKSGIFIHYDYAALEPYKERLLKLRRDFCEDVIILKLFPGITKEMVKIILAAPNLKGVVLETYGSGNAPEFEWFIELIEEAVRNDILIINITQCIEGFVVQGRYKTSAHLNSLGIISGLDFTTEAALVKMMMVLTSKKNIQEKKRMLLEPWAGELTVKSSFN